MVRSCPALREKKKKDSSTPACSPGRQARCHDWAQAPWPPPRSVVPAATGPWAFHPHECLLLALAVIMATQSFFSPCPPKSKSPFPIFSFVPVRAETC